MGDQLRRLACRPAPRVIRLEWATCPNCSEDWSYMTDRKHTSNVEYCPACEEVMDNVIYRIENGIFGKCKPPLSRPFQ